MNFTREPIIETIISPREGYKLLVRNSKGAEGEEYFIDAVEVVSFGGAFFFRSLERPKAFLVPVADYEVLEIKEVRVALKHITHEKNIKIGGGKESRQSREKEPKELPPSETAEISVEETASENLSEARVEKRRDKRRHRRRRGSGAPEESELLAKKPFEEQPPSEPTSLEAETPSAPPLFSALIPPPPLLISQTLNRLKEKEPVAEEGPSLSEGVKIEDEKIELFSEEELPSKPEEPPPPEENSESSSTHRTATQEEAKSLFGEKEGFYFF